MNKEGLKYNTDRDDMAIPEYGRNIEIMIKHLMEIGDRKKRTDAANFIVSVMAQMNPQVKESNDYIHKLWDHMYIISDFKLDVDGPYDPPQIKNMISKPEHINYQKHDIKYGHYGQYIGKILEKITDMEDGPEKDTLLISIANHMKKDYLNWNRKTVNDLLILDDLYKLSNEKLIMPMDTELIPTNELLTKPQQKQQTKKKKNKKTNGRMKNTNINKLNNKK